jgi:hypothetical protein
MYKFGHRIDCNYLIINSLWKNKLRQLTSNFRQKITYSVTQTTSKMKVIAAATRSKLMRFVLATQAARRSGQKPTKMVSLLSMLDLPLTGLVSSFHSAKKFFLINGSLKPE